MKVQPFVILLSFFTLILGQNDLFAGYIEYAGTSCNSKVDYMYIANVDTCLVMNFAVTELATWHYNSSYVDYTAYSNQENHVCNATTSVISVSIQRDVCVYTDEKYTCWSAMPNPFDYEPTWEIIVNTAYHHNGDCSGTPLYYKVAGVPLCDAGISYSCSSQGTLQAFLCTSDDCSGTCNPINQVPSGCTTNNTWLNTRPPNGYTASSVCSYRTPPSPTPSPGSPSSTPSTGASPSSNGSPASTPSAGTSPSKSPVPDSTSESTRMAISVVGIGLALLMTAV